ncbi:hypothetical protein RNZ50_02925 [Paracoccaceae bacterium Fryx2]|nr:hypothetical protein [Paracoccaceae bacterium Fryx2]
MRAAVLLLAALAACGPVTREQAERACYERARLAEAPRGMAGLGVGNRGVAGKLSVTVTSDYLMGRDPSAIYDQCVYQKSGLPPSQPLYSRTDWKG